MAIYPLTKNPINANSSASELKAAQDLLEQSVSDLENAISSIESNLYGEEFDKACEYINNKIMVNIADSIDSINAILRNLTIAVNDYNDDIKDAEGNPFKVDKVNYETGKKLDISTKSASKASPDLPVEAEKDNVKKTRIPSSWVPAHSNTNSNSNSSNDSSKTVSSIEDEIFISLIDSCFSTSNVNFEEKTIVEYSDQKYTWDLIVKTFIKKNNLEDYINNFTFTNNVVKCYLKNNTYVLIYDVKTYDDLLNGINSYKSAHE